MIKIQINRLKAIEMVVKSQVLLHENLVKVQREKQVKKVTGKWNLGFRKLKYSSSEDLIRQLTQLILKAQRLLIIFNLSTEETIEIQIDKSSEDFLYAELLS